MSVSQKHKVIKQYCKNIVYNYNHDIDTDIYSQVIDMSKDLGISIDIFEKNYQYFAAGDHVTAKQLFKVITVENLY